MRLTLMCPAIFRRLLPTLPCLAIVVIGSFGAGSAMAQSTGLKLGESPEPAPKLDLGARPAAPEQQPAAPAAQAPANNAGSIASTAASRTTYGAWEVACLEGGSNCAMAQIGNDKTGTPVLEMVLRKLPEPLESGGRTAIAVLDVITPLGVVLTSGLGVTIDNGTQESAPFQICTEQGCLVREPIDEALVNRLKRGNVARVQIVAASQGDVIADISLSGFTKAYAALK